MTLIDRSSLLRRFLSYVRVETTSCEESDATPSSEGQWNLARMLVGELEELGLADVHLDEHCYVYGHLPERLARGSKRAGKIPAIGLIAHLDVSPAVPGKDVKPIVHERYDGGSIRLPHGEITLTPENDPPLGECKGLDIVTSDGSTLLGADDKAGIAVILTLLETLQRTPELEHGPIYVAFTPDEEIGRGVNHFNLERFAAEAAYTVDGKSVGEVEDETFFADTVEVVFRGINVHPGYAKGIMVNAIKLAAEFVGSLPAERAPETTDGRQGYVHPTSSTGSEEVARVKLLVRDFSDEGRQELERMLEAKARAVEQAHPGARLEIGITRSYKNMKLMIDRRPEVTQFALAAVAAAGLKSVLCPVRGGTDGARLSFLGLPTPNLFTGGQSFHARREWIAVQHMEKAVDVCLRLAQIWAERGEKKGRLPRVD